MYILLNQKEVLLHTISSPFSLPLKHSIYLFKNEDLLMLYLKNSWNKVSIASSSWLLLLYHFMLGKRKRNARRKLFHTLATYNGKPTAVAQYFKYFPSLETFFGNKSLERERKRGPEICRKCLPNLGPLFSCSL